MDVAAADGGLDELGVRVELAVVEIKVGSANKTSVPAFGAQAMYE